MSAGSLKLSSLQASCRSMRECSQWGVVRRIPPGKSSARGSQTLTTRLSQVSRPQQGCWRSACSRWEGAWLPGCSRTWSEHACMGNECIHGVVTPLVLVQVSRQRQACWRCWSSVCSRWEWAWLPGCSGGACQIPTRSCPASQARFHCPLSWVRREQSACSATKLYLIRPATAIPGSSHPVWQQHLCVSLSMLVLLWQCASERGYSMRAVST